MHVGCKMFLKFLRTGHPLIRQSSLSRKKRPGLWNFQILSRSFAMKRPRSFALRKAGALAEMIRTFSHGMTAEVLPSHPSRDPTLR